jgi:hypothetical protein
MGLLSWLNVLFAAVSSAGLFLGKFANHDDEQDDHTATPSTVQSHIPPPAQPFIHPLVLFII